MEEFEINRGNFGVNPCLLGTPSSYKTTLHPSETDKILLLREFLLDGRVYAHCM